MEVDEVLHQINGFGRRQKTLFLLIGLPHIWSTLQVLSMNFIGADPGWTCRLPQADGYEPQLQGYGEKAHVGVDVTGLTDPVAKCAYYNQGECVPKFSEEYTSVVTEVRNF